MPSAMPRRRVDSEYTQQREARRKDMPPSAAKSSPAPVTASRSLPTSESCKSVDEMRHHQRRQQRLGKLGRSYSSPVQADPDNEIEMLSPKANGSAVEGEDMTKPNKTTIRWMWKNAFKSLKMRDRDKEKDRERGDRDKDRDDRSDKSSEREEKKYSRMASRQSSIKKSALKQKDSKEQPTGTEDEPENPDEVGEIDPVYSLLKCAADLPRQSKLGQSHACCLQRGDMLTVRPNSRSSSPSSELVPPSNLQGDAASTVSQCSCSCHTPEVLAGYHLSLLNSFVIKKS